MKTLVIGGARSGKSRHAESLYADRAAVTYVATGYPAGDDEEWAARIAKHVADRPGSWRTVETLDLASLFAEPGDPVLVDCLTLWLTRTMDAADTWTTGARVDEAVAALVAAIEASERDLVLVTNEVGQGVVPADPGTRRFVDEMGRLNAAVAAVCDDVLWCVAGRVVRL